MTDNTSSSPAAHAAGNDASSASAAGASPRPAPVGACHDGEAHADVIIVGAGPAGLALACALADAGLKPLLVEQQPLEAVAAPKEDGRDIALTHRARRVMTTLGLWSEVPPDLVAPLREACVVDGSGTGPLHFSDPTVDTLGWLIPNHAIREAAYKAAQRRPTIGWITGAKVTGLTLGDPMASVTLADGRMLHAPLVVAADSRFSGTRRLAGIGASMNDFGRSVVVGRVAHEADHNGVAWECFRYGNTLALLPMNNRQCSAVVTVDSHKAPEWLALDDEAFAARIQAQAGGRLGTVRAAGPRHHYPLVGVYAHRFVGHRFALIGDAAVGMHPVTAHGYNFGLYGIEVLARELQSARRSGRDIGARQVLEPYEREHRLVTRPVYLGTNAIVGLFTSEQTLAKLARRAVLTVSEQAPGVSQLVKAAITAQLTGRRIAGLPPLPPLPGFPGFPPKPEWPPTMPAWAQGLRERVMSGLTGARVTRD